MSVFWMPCFLCKIKKEDFKGQGKLELGENFNKFAKFNTDICPLCDGKGRLGIKPYTEKPWEKYRRKCS